jgi:hypothetical protein
MMKKRKTPSHRLEAANKTIGKKYGNLTVLEILGPNEHHKIIAECLCDCGNKCQKRLSELIDEKRQIKRHCGCMGRNIDPADIRKASALGVQKMIELGIAEKDPKIATAKEVFYFYGKDGDLSFEQFLQLSQQNCFYCEVPPSNCRNSYLDGRRHPTPERIRDGYFTYNGLDRVDSDMGHSYDNVVPACHPCNWAKSDKSQQEFIDWVVKVYNSLKRRGMI